MKKVLLAGTALVGLAALSAPAHAELKTELGGFFRGYGVYADQDETMGATNLHNFELRRENEIHFNGETTLDNGLTVGAHTELDLSAANVTNEETYAYFSGGWGRVNFGTEDGAAYLLQIAAPSADSNVDGLRPTIGSDQTSLAGFATYQHADFTATDRLTYLTPKFNGFQGGVSFTPINARALGNQDLSVDNSADDFENLWEVAARWDGEFQGVGVSAGAGYSHASIEDAAAAISFDDDLQTWNGGLNVTWNGFSLGGVYKLTNNAISAASSDTETWVAGLGWDNGPYHLGASYLAEENESAVPAVGAATAGADVEKITLGGGYTYGPGMTFRGAFQWGKVDNVAAANDDFTQATLGTDIQF